jgi:hypothetical protein
MTVKVVGWLVAVAGCVVGSVAETVEGCTVGAGTVVAEAVPQALRLKTATTSKSRLEWLVFISHLLIKN